MSAKSGKVFFMACGQRDAALKGSMNRDGKASGNWPEWAKRAYFIGYTSNTIFKKVKP